MVRLINSLAFIAASNTNVPYLESMLGGGVVHFDALPPPIPTADEKIHHELYFLSFPEGTVSSGGISAGVHHPPLKTAVAAGKFDFLLILYYLALAVLVFYPLTLPCVRGRVRKRAKAEAESKRQDANGILQR